jgi:uncharacterized protein YeaO (DUF488 family)
MIKLKRVYEPPEAADGTRFLVERLWPRGMRKEALSLLQRRYAAELDARPDPWRPILAADRQGAVTLLYSAHDTEHNNAAALQAYLTAHRAE